MADREEETRAVAVRQVGSAEVVLSDATERLMVGGDLSGLSPDQRVEYYRAVAQSMGVDWRRRPFDYMVVKAEGSATKLILYANHACADMLGDARDVRCQVLDRREEDGLYVVEVRASLPNGRYHDASAYVPIEEEGGEWRTVTNRKGENVRVFERDGTVHRMRGLNLANAKMKTETKAYRRAILALTGMSAWADEPPTGSVRVDVDIETGEEMPRDPREAAMPTPPKARSKRYHTRPDQDAHAADPAPSGTEPSDEAAEPEGQREGAEVTPLPDNLKAAISKVIEQFMQGDEPAWGKDPKRRIPKRDSAAKQLALHDYTPQQAAALYSMLHTAAHNEGIDIEGSAEKVDARAFSAVEALGTPDLYALRDCADWWIERQGA